MKLAPHDPKWSAAHRPHEQAGSRWPLLVASALSITLAGCDIVQGFQDAGNSLFPEQSTHLASPGLRVVHGNYKNLGVIGGRELYLLARGADDDTSKLFAMRYAEPQPCEIAGVVRFSATRDASRKAPLLSYFEEDVRIGTLRFADADCQTFPLTFEEARLPVAETPTSVVVWAADELWLATPESGSKKLLAEGVSSVTGGVFGGRYAVRTGGQVTLFDSAWKEQGSFGDEVDGVLRAGRSLFYTDKSGAHRVVSSASGALESELLVAGGCSLASQEGTWIFLRAPCSDGRLLTIHEPTGDVFELPFDAASYRVKLVPARGSRGRDPLTDPFWSFYLKNGAEEGAEDSLFVRTPQGDEHVLGARSSFTHMRLVEAEGEDPYGYALVDLSGETGRYLWWNAAGETRVLAEGTMWRPDRLIIDFDGVVGRLAVTSGDRLRVLAEGVPWQAFEYRDPTLQWTTLFHDMNGDGLGRLSVLTGGIDQIEAVSPRAPFELPELSPVASDVVVAGTSSMQALLSGVVYVTDPDPETRTGRLLYRNLELRFTADINDGVSDYLVAHDEMLYAIPYGKNAGIWLVSGK